MTKFDLETKLEIVADYEAGVGGYKTLAKKHHTTVSNVKRWVHNYQDFGLEGLNPKTSKRHYSVEMKLNAIELYLETDLSYREVGVEFDINNPSLIANWLRAFQREGIDGLSKSSGRPPTMSKSENTKKTKHKDTSLLNKVTELEHRIQELEDKNKSLDIENKFLKELRRLREAEKRQHKSR